jgi:hypothetical protein
MSVRLDATSGTIELLNTTPKDFTCFANSKNGKLLIY